MLKDRRILLQKEIDTLHDRAAHMYLEIVTTGVDNPDYAPTRDKLTGLQQDLRLVNNLIYKGHE